MSRWPLWIDWLAWVAAGIATLVVAVGLFATPSGPADQVEAIASRLRCPVCQTVSVAESPSQQARDMREIILQQVAEGRTDQEIIASFVDRYGEWVILDPPARGATLALWLLPPAAIFIGLLVAGGRLRRGRLRRPRPNAP